MKKIIKWFNKFERKRRLLFVFLILYAISSISSIVIPYFYKDLGVFCFIVYGITTGLFLFQYIYVMITDHQDFEKKLFNRN
jgi:hypothetical protein